jgi:uncharacterized membrane protein YjgN (DUF898 family)
VHPTLAPRPLGATRSTTETAVTDPIAPPSGPTAQPAAPLPAEPAPRSLELRFTGSGGEYFRIWIVNLALTIVTLGIYSAWAKVRKARYFSLNTQLDGSAFQYHASPAAILRGRLLVAAYFVAYSLLGRLSITAGLVALGVGGLAMPWLLVQATRFKLTNTSWRNVRFGFDGTAASAYQILLPAIGLWLGMMAFAPRPQPGEQPSLGAFGLFGLLYLVLAVLLPLFHARLTAFRQGSTRLGGLPFAFQRSVGAYYGLYAKVLGLVMAAGLGVALLVAAVAIAGGAGAAGGAPQPPKVMVALFVAAALLFYVLAGAFFFARQQVLVWSRTSAPGVRLGSTMQARRLAWLLLRYGVVTLATAGLAWPWAAVALVRYQLECLRVEVAAGALDRIAAGGGAVETGTTGDGAVDLLGWDLGW